MKTTQKTQNFPQKIKIRVGAWTTFEFFSDFWNYFNLTKPLKRGIKSTLTLITYFGQINEVKNS